MPIAPAKEGKIYIWIGGKSLEKAAYALHRADFRHHVLFQRVCYGSSHGNGRTELERCSAVYQNLHRQS